MFPIPGSSNVQETKGIPVIQFVRPKISSVLLSKSRSQLEMAASPHLQNEVKEKVVKPKSNIKKPISKKLNAKQAKYVAPDSIKKLVNSRYDKTLKKHSPLLLSSAIKALTISLLKNAADRAKENESNQVTIAHLKAIIPSTINKCIQGV